MRKKLLVLGMVMTTVLSLSVGCSKEESKSETKQEKEIPFREN